MTINASHNDNKWLDLGIDPGTGKARVIGAGTTHRTSVWRSALRAVVPELHVHRREPRRHHPALRGQGRQPPDERTASGSPRTSSRSRTASICSAAVSASTACSTTRAAAMGSTAITSSARRARRRARRRTIRHRRSGCRRAPLRRRTAPTYNGTNYTIRLGYFSSNQFWRFREVSAVYQLPDRAESTLRPAANGSSFVFGARNLQTWSSFTGVDPEENYGTSNEVAE